MFKIVGWKIWYVDSIYTSDRFKFEDTPDDGVIGMMIYFSDGTRRVMYGRDLYFWTGETFGDSDHPIPLVQARYPGAIIKQGKWIDDGKMREMEHEMLGDTWRPTA